MDQNTPNVSNPLIEGDPMRDSMIKIKLKNSSTDSVKAIDFSVLWIPSERSNK